MPARTAYLLALDDAAVVKIQVVESSIASLAVALGMTKLPDSGEVPDGKVLVGSGKAAALAGGAIPVNIVYYVPATKKNQTAKVLVSPTKAGSNMFDTLRGLTYAGKAITDARSPRRRVYTF
jgi:hypothetical protein